MAKRKVSDRMMDLTAKIGVHPYHATKVHALKAVDDGKLTEDECNEFLNALDALDNDGVGPNASGEATLN